MRAEIDTHDWNSGFGDCARGREERAIPAEHDHELKIVLAHFVARNRAKPVRMRSRFGIDEQVASMRLQPLDEPRHDLGHFRLARLGDNPDCFLGRGTFCHDERELYRVEGTACYQRVLST